MGDLRKEAARSLVVAAKDDAPGIPKKGKIRPIPSVKKKTWEYAIQHHLAAKAGPHYDVRLGNPSTGVGHSWVMHKIPEPGESVSGIQTNDHRLEYFKFQGEIPPGNYGAGTVRRHTLDKAEIIESDPKKINFNHYQGRDTNQYTLVNIGGKHWRMINRTPTKKGLGLRLPESKPKYREIKPERADPEREGRWDAKIDGAHLVYHMQPGKPIQALSHRESRITDKLLNHTFRIPSLSGKRAPRDMKGETILRGEVYARDPKTRKAIPAARLGGILNASVPKSREKQKTEGKLENVIFDIAKFQGRDVSGLPTEEKRKLIREVILRRGLRGVFREPPTATTPDQKRKLLQRIRSGDLPETKEGIIIHSPSGTMTKAKIKPEFDVRIRGVFTKPKSEARGHAGGFYYDEVDGKKVKGKPRVGTGFSQRLRKAMLESPNAYEGVVAKVTGLEQHPSGAIRSPSFLGWHQDKNDPDRIPEIQK